MASIVSAGTTSATALNMSADTTGILQLSSNNGTVGLTMDTSQNVGIGTTSPATYGKFAVVSSTAGAAKISIQDTSGGSASSLLQFGINDTSGFNTSDASRIWTTASSATAASLNFAAYNGGAPSTAQMSLVSAGLKIGTTSAAMRKLIVASASAMKLGTSTGALFSDTANDGGVLIGSDYTFGNIQGCNAAGTSAKDITMQPEGGNLLVGATSGAGSKLYVLASSASAIRGDASTATTVAIYGVHGSNSSTGYVAYLLNSGASNGQYLTNTGSWQALSDVRLKTDIKNLDSTNRLMQLRPVDYLWKSQETSEEPNKRNFGFIAQEVKEIFPELVTVSPDGMFGVEYTGLISPLVKAIQELSAKVTALEEQVLNLGVK
jgi:hypothetical protein